MAGYRTEVVVCWAGIGLLFFLLSAFALCYHYPLPMYEHIRIVDYLDAWNAGTWRFMDASQINGGHWMLFSVNAEVLLAWLTHFSLTAETLLVLATVALIFALWAYVLRQACASVHEVCPLLLLGAFICFSFNQASNLLWPWTLLEYFHNVGIMLCVATLASPRYTLWQLGVALAGVILAVYDYSSGLAMLPLYALGMWLHPAARKYLWIWLLLAAPIAAHTVYVILTTTTVEQKHIHEMHMLPLRLMPVFIIRYLAAPVASTLTFTVALSDIPAALGVLALMFCTYAHIAVWRHRREASHQRLIPALLLMDTVIGSAMLTAIGRGGYGLIQAYAYRYNVIGNLFWLGACLAAWGLSRAYGAQAPFFLRRRMLVSAGALLVIVYIVNSGYIANHEYEQYKRFDAAATAIRTEWPQVDPLVLGALTFYPPGVPRDSMDYLREMHDKNLGLFH